MPSAPLTPRNRHKVMAALSGNGELCTTVGPSGYHSAPQGPGDDHQPRSFVLAGRRKPGARHPLVGFGTLSRGVESGGVILEPLDWEQSIDWAGGAVVSCSRFENLDEETRSFVALGHNAFIAQTTWTAREDVELSVVISYAPNDSDMKLRSRAGADVRLAFEVEEHLGEITFGAQVLEGEASLRLHPGAQLTPHPLRGPSPGACASLWLRLEVGQSVTMLSWLHFSDRMAPQFPVSAQRRADGFERAVADVVAEHESGWAEFWARSEIETGDADVDEFRRSCLYTVRCQATPWGVPPVLAHGFYWDGGVFHDELWPFLALHAFNSPGLARRVPRARLATLPGAIERGRNLGALFAWCATERGEDMDPFGHSLSERHHLGHIASVIWFQWLYERERDELADLYPVLRELARFQESEMIQRDSNGRPQTRPCMDYDEAVGAIANGPYTLASAIRSLESAALAARELNRDEAAASRWAELADELRQVLPHDAGEDVYLVPGQPLHVSVLGYSFPFRVDERSERARRTAALFTRECRSMRSWKPGAAPACDGQDWTWTAGHLGTVHARQEDASAAWDCVQAGPRSAGPLACPNEHTRGRWIGVPWFTTGAGAWLCALASLWAQIDEDGTRLLPAVPDALLNARFHDLRASHGVLVSGEFKSGQLVHLSARAPRPMPWLFRIPERWAGAGLAGAVAKRESGWLHVEQQIEREPTSLLQAP